MAKEINQPLWVASVTPFAKDGTIDFTSWESLLRKQDAAGNGIVLLGSTGEGLALSDDEKKEVVQWASALRLSAPIMVGVGGFQLPQQIAWMQWCEKQGVDSFLLSNPIYAKPGPQGQIDWFGALLSSTGTPCMLYNHPGRSGIRLAVEVLYALKSHPNFWAVKDAGSDFDKTRELVQAAPELLFFSGEDDAMSVYAQLGFFGLVSVCGNVWPVQSRDYLQRCLDGDGVEELQHWVLACQELCCATNPIPAKVLLAQKKWISSATVRPPLSLDDLPQENRLLEWDRRLVGSKMGPLSSVG